MNERIKELASKAGIYGAVDINGNFANEAEVKKFAELIVRECGVVAYKTYCQSPGSLGIHYKKVIEEHFGVEE